MQSVGSIGDTGVGFGVVGGMYCDTLGWGPCQACCMMDPMISDDSPDVTTF